MKNIKCTFTGLDEFTNLNELEEVTKKYPFVEWGILLSTSDNKSFTDFRYPSVDFLLEKVPKIFEITKKYNSSLALHVCGKETKLLLEGSEISVARKLINSVNRVQINFAYKEKQVQELSSLCSLYENVNFITQHNIKNNDLYLKIKNKNHQILFDTSGGRGIETEIWLEQLPEKKCGYAGGLGLDNIQVQLDHITKVGIDNFWIDMEGKIRVDGKLSLNICEEILKIVKETIWNKK